MARVVLGVSGGIAAYKACELTRRLRANQHDVIVVPTAAALEFVGAATWAALSGHEVHTGVFESVSEVAHVAIGRSAELVIVAPATADLLARAATGRADDLLTSVLLTATCPVAFVPAMHTEMWLHPATQANVATLRSRGAVVTDPDEGRLTGADSGPGRLPEPEEIEHLAELLLANPQAASALAAQDLQGRRIVVSAGGTREALDPVRFLGNESSGRMGMALARTARWRGAEVTLVAAHCADPAPGAVTVVPVTSTADLQAAMRTATPGADAVVMAAAPADFTPAQTSATKITKDKLTKDELTQDEHTKDEHTELKLSLTTTPDVLAGLASQRGSAARPVLVGFAAETLPDREALVARARVKLTRKGCDLVVANDVSAGAVFGATDTDVVVVSPEDAVEFTGSKTSVAHQIWNRVAVLIAGLPPRPEETNPR